MASAARRIREALGPKLSLSREPHTCPYLPRALCQQRCRPQAGQRWTDEGGVCLTCLALLGLALDLLHTLGWEPSDVAAGAAFPEAPFADAQN